MFQCSNERKNPLNKFLLKKFQVIAIAGTFDRLHRGHERFISETFKLGDRVIIGVTSDLYIQKNLKFKIKNLKLNENLKLKIENYKKRKRQLEDFLRKKRLLRRAEIVKIDDVYGPACRQAGRREDKQIEALVVTSETLAGARKVNRKRRELGLPLLRIIRVPMVRAQDFRRIASTRIRSGEIDRCGTAFSRLPVFGKSISEDMRMAFKKPIGKLFKGDQTKLKYIISEVTGIIRKRKPTMVITVGDEVTKYIQAGGGIEVAISVVDFKVMRRMKYRTLEEIGIGNEKLKNLDLYTVRNRAGNVGKTLVSAIKKAIRRYQFLGRRAVIRVLGEEDLAGLPAILLAPLGSVVIYGQPPAYVRQLADSGEAKPASVQDSGEAKPASVQDSGEAKGGVVVVEVTEEKKKEIVRIIDNTNHTIV